MPKPKIPDETIAKIKELRKTHTQVQTAKLCGVSVKSVHVFSKDVPCEIDRGTMRIDTAKSNRVAFVAKCKEYPMGELSDEDKKKYAECKPPVKEKVNYGFM